jgi:hypothetical protein
MTQSHHHQNYILLLSFTMSVAAMILPFIITFVKISSNIRVYEELWNKKLKQDSFLSPSPPPPPAL